ncbi:putative alcohol dehydrogenase [Trichoderma compactum]
MARLDGKVAIITGAGSGFREAIAHGFVDQGAHVIVADIAVEEARESVTNRTACESGLAFAKENYGKLDIVVNNAGTTYRKQPSVDVSEVDFDKIIAVNVKGIYLSVSVIMSYFLQRNYGVYLNTSSVAGTRVRPGHVFYGGTKESSNTITQALAAEYGPSGVRVNSLCPLRGATGLLEMFSGIADTPEKRERFASSVPLRRMAEPNDIAQTAVYLASDEAAFITGVNLPVDGGRLAV